MKFYVTICTEAVTHCNYVWLCVVRVPPYKSVFDYNVYALMRVHVRICTAVCGKKNMYSLLECRCQCVLKSKANTVQTSFFVICKTIYDVLLQLLYSIFKIEHSVEIVLFTGKKNAYLICFIMLIICFICATIHNDTV